MWRVFLREFTHLSDVLFFQQLYDPYKWDTVRKGNKQALMNKLMIWRQREYDQTDKKVPNFF